MGYYFSLRGWIEVGDPGFRQITRQIEKLQSRAELNTLRHLYLTGWTWTEQAFNGTGYLFYGGTVQEEGLDLLEEVLTVLTSLGYGIQGYFHAEGEDRQRNYHYQVHGDDQWEVSEAAPLQEDLPWTTERLFNEVRQQQTLLDSLLAGYPAEQLTTARAPGSWTVKEVLAHLSAWNQRATAWLGQMRREEDVSIGDIFFPETRDRFNHEVHIQAQSRNLSESMAEWHKSQQEVLDAIMRLPPRDWSTSAELAWLYVYEITVEHYQEHREQLAEWLVP